MALSGVIPLVAGLVTGIVLPLWAMDSLSQRPAVRIVSPNPDTPVSGIVRLQAVADVPGIDSVQFRVSGQDVGPRITSGPCELEWDSRTVGNGVHIVDARAQAILGWMIIGEPLPIIVNNPDAPPRRAQPRF